MENEIQDALSSTVGNSGSQSGLGCVETHVLPVVPPSRTQPLSIIVSFVVTRAELV